MRKIDSKKIISLLAVFIVFVGAFVLLINKNKEENLADIGEQIPFNVQTIKGKQLVARDMNSSYPKFYVVYFGFDDEFDIHVYNFYNSFAEYHSEFNALMDNVLDYNAKEKMIRILYTKGVGEYEKVKNNLGEIVESDNLRIYE